MEDITEDFIKGEGIFKSKKEQRQETASDLKRLVSDNRRWKSVDEEPPPVNEQLVFWHFWHKCPITGTLVGNEVIEQTKTTKWPLEAFDYYTEPLNPPE